MVDFFIKRPIFATVCALLIILAGAVCIPTLPVSLYPTLAPPQVTVSSNYVGANAPPGGCGCFSLNGGSGWFGYDFDRGLALVAEVSGSHAANINGTASDLTLTSYLFGPRYSRQFKNRLLPFAQVLLGGAHASGALRTPRSRARGVGSLAERAPLTVTDKANTTTDKLTALRSMIRLLGHGR